MGGQGCVLQASCALPAQSSPPWSGSGESQLRERTPPPQGHEQVPQPPQPPFCAQHHQRQSIRTMMKQFDLRLTTGLLASSAGGRSATKVTELTMRSR